MEPTMFAGAKAKRVGKVWSLVVAVCPFCGDKHTHGGGDGDKPDYGHRISECRTGEGGSYYLKAFRA